MINITVKPKNEKPKRVQVKFPYTLRVPKMSHIQPGADTGSIVCDVSSCQPIESLCAVIHWVDVLPPWVRFHSYSYRCSHHNRVQW